MPLRPDDTSAEAFEVLVRAARRSTAEQKLAQTLALTEFSRDLTKAGLRGRYPNASERELHWRFAALLYGEQMATKVLGWSP